MNIHLVVVIHDEPARRRTWGWYSNFEEAERAVLENYTDIFERGYYNLAVIEEMPEGVMAIAEKEWWYRAIYAPEATDPTVERIEKPAIFEQNFNFAIG